MLQILCVVVALILTYPNIVVAIMQYILVYTNLIPLCSLGVWVHSWHDRMVPRQGVFVH